MESVVHLNLIGPGFDNTGWKKAFFDNNFHEYQCIDWVKLKVKRGPSKMWDILFRFLNKKKPDLLFMQIQTPGILTVEVAKRLKSLVKKTVLYNIDARTEEEAAWMYDVAPYLSFCALSNQRDVDVINKILPGRSVVVQSSCDMNYYNPGSFYIFKTGTDIVFLANNYQDTNRKFPLCNYRQSLVKKLYKWYPDKFKCFGRRQQEPMVSPYEEVRIYQQAKIAICCSNFDLPEYTSDRIWRAMACGCFVLVKYFDGIDSLFDISKHLDTWKTPEELKQKIDYYLDHPIERSIYARQGCGHVRVNHNLSRRVDQIISQIY